MTRSFDSLLAATRTIGLTIAVVGCAASPIVESDGGERVEADGGLMATEAPASQDDKNEPGVDPNADLGSGSPSAPGAVNTKPDAGADAGSARPDSGAQDAGSKAPDTAVDAAIADAGRGTSVPVDSGTTTPTPTPTPTRDAGVAPPKPGSCRSAADCTTSCVPIGILNCCRDNGTCGCTWAPGAYCS